VLTPTHSSLLGRHLAVTPQPVSGGANGMKGPVVVWRIRPLSSVEWRGDGGEVETVAGAGSVLG
jgi:hypothetical protein